MDTDEHGAMMLEAITTSKMRLERTMSAFAKALNQQLQGTNLQAGAPELGRVRKTGGVAIMPAVMSLSDGQSITVMFHSPTNDPSKISTDDTLVAFRFLLNKRDVTHVVSPDGGKDISLKQTCLSLANLAEKNTAKFQAAQERANKLKTDLENYRAQAAQLDEQAAQLIDQGDKLKAKEDGNQAELATITAKADKQEQLNNELRKQLEAAQAKAKAASEGATTPPAAAGNGEARKTLELAKKAIQEAYSHQKSADKITATIERRGESARLTFNRNSYHTMRTKALSQAEELFTKYVQQGGTAADWDAGVPEEIEGVASYEFMLAKTGAQPAAQPAGATTPPASTGDDGAITAGKPIQRLVTRDEHTAILGDKVDDVSRTGWALHAGKGDYAGQFVLNGGNDGQRKVIAVGFTSQDEAIQWAKENRRNKVGLEKQSAKLNDFKKMLAAADRAYEQASGKTLTADAVIDSKADAEQQDKQKAAFAHVITDAAKSILSYASSQGIPLNPSLSNVSARNLVASALGVTTGRDTLPDNIDADISIEPNEKLVFDGSALVNGKVSIDEFIRVLKSYGGRYAEAESEVDDNGGQEQLLADAKEYLNGATLPADITKQTPADYIRSKMKEDFEARESYFLKYAKAIGSTNAVMGLYAQHLGSVDKNKTLEQLKAMAISQYAKEVNGLPRDTVFSQEMMRGAVNEPALEKQISGWARQFFNWDENLSSKTVMDSTDNVLASLVKEKATAKIKELIADVAKETLPDGLHKMANSAGDIADAQSINGVSVKMPSLTFAYDTTGKPSKNEFKKSGVIVSPDFNEAGEATGYRVTHNGSTQVFNSWEGMKETVFKLAGAPEAVGNSLQEAASKLYNEIKADGLHSAIKVTLDSSEPSVTIISHDGADYQIVPTPEGRYAVMGDGDKLGEVDDWGEAKDLLESDYGFEFDGEVIQKVFDEEFNKKTVNIVSDMAKKLGKLIESPYEMGIEGTTTTKGKWRNHEYEEPIINISMELGSDRAKEFEEEIGHVMDLDDVGVTVMPEYVGGTKEPTGSFRLVDGGEGMPLDMPAIKTEGLTTPSQIRKSAYAVMDEQFNEAMEDSKAARAAAAAKANSSANPQKKSTSKELEQKLDAMQFGTKELKDYVPAGLSGDEVKSQLSAISRMYAHMDAAFRDVNALFGKTTRERMLGHYFGFDDYTAHQLANAETSGTDLGGTRIAKVPDNGSMLDAEKLANGEYTKAELMNMFGIKDYSTNSDNSAADTGSDAGDDTNAKAVTDAVSALERIRDANVANMSLQEVNDAAAEIERLINTLMELGAYTENESLAEAATQPLVDRMMELAA
ncbi:MAG: hypothetical protein ACRCSS_22215 [Shewanella sp.]